MACWGVPTSRRGRRPLLSTKQGEQSSSCGRQGSQGTCQGAGPAASLRACSALAVGDAAAEGQLLLLRFQPLLFLPSPPHPHHVPCPLRFSLRLLLSPAAPTPPFFFSFLFLGNQETHILRRNQSCSPQQGFSLSQSAPALQFSRRRTRWEPGVFFRASCP